VGDAEKIENELEKYQSQVLQLEGEIESLLEYFQDRSYREREELVNTKTQLQQTQEDLKRTQEELGQIKSEFDRVEMELGLVMFRQVLERQTDDPRQRRYREWVWCGWYAYQKGNPAEMVRYLQQSFNYTPFSQTRTISDWLRCFAQWAEREGKPVDVQGLARLVEWRQLVGELVSGKQWYQLQVGGWNKAVG
jgi:hypothetical protein